METTTNNYIAVAYKLYTTENGKKKLQEEAPASAPFQFISGLGMVLDNFEAGSVVDIDALAEKGLIKLIKNSVGLKVLAGGAVNKALTVKAAAFSASAKEAIEKAGGTAEII